MAGAVRPAGGASHAAILTGGASRRMGRDKALVDVGGVPMVLRVRRALLAGGTDEPLAVGGDRVALAGLGLTVVDDPRQGEGPLAGVATALATVLGRTPDAAGVLVVACDLPWLDGPTVARVLGAADPVGGRVPDVAVAFSTRLEPLCAWWGRATLDVVEQALERGERAVHRVLEAADLVVRRVQVDGSALRNVNTAADLERAGVVPVGDDDVGPSASGANG